MAVIYVAASKALGEWAEAVGLTKYVYKLGVTEGAAKDAVQALNDREAAGQTDWTLLAKDDAETDEAGAHDRLALKEKLVAPAHYPKLREEAGVFKVKVVNVENHMLVKYALEGGDPKRVKMKPKDIGLYLIRNALA